MSRIHILDEQTIDQIAAGEVVERPVSVVKELVENALDAGADSIVVEINGGGMDLIRVTDNGRGIPREDVPLAFFRHATSKIETAEDLFALSSLGFRGEALSSIASVARVEMITRTREEESALRYVIEGGLELSREECAAPSGTVITVRDLFFNTPVRRRFMKSPNTETSYIITLMEHLLLSRPGAAMSLITDGKLRLKSGSSYSDKEIIYTLFGREVAGHLRPVLQEKEKMSLTGYAGEPLLNRGNRSGELIFVNGRYVKSPLLMKAVEQAYHGLVMQHKFPMVFLHLKVEPSLVDVNVHPQKTEVRFSEEKAVFDLVYRGVRDALFARDLIPSAAEEKKDKQDLLIQESASYHPAKTHRILADLFRREDEKGRDNPPVSWNEPAAHTENGMSAENKDLIRPDTAFAQESFKEEIMIHTENKKRFRLIGQVFGTYWLLEYEDWFLMADQHAVHEKILYERTMKSLNSKEATAQQLLPPLLISLSGAQWDILKRYENAFYNLGFEIEELGGREIRLNAVPGNLFSLSARDLFLSMLDELGEEKVSAPDMIDEKVALMSCKAAVKGNHILSFEEAENLLGELLALDNPYTCPHGRPTMIRMSRTDMEKKFKRVL